MHSWGLYNGRYGVSSLVLINRFPPQDRPLVDAMLETNSSGRSSSRRAGEGPAGSAWLDERHVFQNYKQFQFCDLLALYFNRTHEAARGEQTFDRVPTGCTRRRHDHDPAARAGPV